MNKNHQMLLIGFGVGLAATYLFLNKKSEKSDFLGFDKRKKRHSGALNVCKSRNCEGYNVTADECYGCPDQTVRLGGGGGVVAESKTCKCGDGIGVTTTVNGKSLCMKGDKICMKGGTFL
jgi:hypothetical protein